MPDKKDKIFSTLFFIFISLVTLATLCEWVLKAKGTGGYFGFSIGWFVWIILILLILLVNIGAVYFILQKRSFDRFRKPNYINPIVIYTIVILITFISIFISIYFQQDKISDSLSRFWIFVESIFLCNIIFVYFTNHKLVTRFLFTSLSVGIIYVAIGQLSLISTDPFSLAWSEGSRYYNASLIFSQSLFGHRLPWAFIDPARSFLQSIPYDMGLRAIVIQRIWQSILWVVLPGIAAYSIVHRYHSKIDGVFALSLIFVFLILLSAPVYFFLVLCVIPLLLWMDPRKPFRTLLLVVMTSFWAGICRVNWFVVPAGLSIFIYLLEVPEMSKKPGQYLVWPFIWGSTGVIIAFISSRIYLTLSGNPMSAVNTATHSVLLWYRLLPNSTYGLGILLSVLLFFTPLFLIPRWPMVIQQLQRLRSILILLILLVFFTAGVIISTKIGAGSNLHELDAFIIFGLVLISYGYFTSDSPGHEPYHPSGMASIGMILTCMIVVAMIALPVKSPERFDKLGINNEVGQLRKLITKYNAYPLFLFERQLLSSGELNPDQFEPDYEGFTLMEMVMANDQGYLDGFYSSLEAHKFSLIICKPLNSNFQGSESKFAKENNLWVKKVEIPILKSYRLLTELPLSRVEVYVPK